MSGIRERLWRGETLRLLLSGDLGFDVWVEKYANPPRVYFEGRALPVDRLDAAHTLLMQLRDRAPEEHRVTLLERVPLHRAILDAR